MRRGGPVRPRASRLAALALTLCACAASYAGRCAEDNQRPRDAAEAVKEGDVSQWLKYYQRERGDGAVPEKPAQPAPSTSGQRDTVEPRTDPATR